MSEEFSLIQVGGHPASWDIPHNVLLVTLTTGSCSVANKKDFDLTSSIHIKEFSNYISSIPAGTIVVGLIGPGLTPDMKGIISTLSTR